MSRSRQLSFRETIYIYQYPHQCHRYWDEDPTRGRETDHGHDITLYCERCGYACRRVGSFTYNPYDYGGTFPDEADLPIPIDDTSDGKGGTAVP